MAKKRVHEIAKAQGLSSKELLAALKKAGIEAKAAASSVEEADALKALSGNGATATKTPPKAGAKPAPAQPKAEAKAAPAKQDGQAAPNQPPNPLRRRKNLPGRRKNAVS